MQVNGEYAGRVARPASPGHWQRVNTGNNLGIWPYDRPIPLYIDVPMEWHHIWPWGRIREVWTALLQTAHDYPIQTAWDAISAWQTVHQWLQNIDDPDPVQTIVHLRQAHANPAHVGLDRDDLSERLCWAPWNVVEGPMERTDDPGEDFDDFAYSESGMSVESTWLQQVHGHTRHWMKGPLIPEAEAAQFTNFLGGAPVSHKRFPEAFRPDAWYIFEGRLGSFDWEWRLLRRKPSRSQTHRHSHPTLARHLTPHGRAAEQAIPSL